MEGAEIAMREERRLEDYEGLVVQSLREMFEFQEERLNAYMEGRMPNEIVCGRAGADAVLCTCTTTVWCGHKGCGADQEKKYNACTRVLANFAAVREARCCEEVRSASSLVDFLVKKYGWEVAQNILGCVESVFKNKIRS